MHSRHVVTAGGSISKAGKALIAVHGRGSSPEDILPVAALLNDDIPVLAPRAENHSWYPHSFLVPPPQNEPWLSSSLGVLNDIVNDLDGRGVPPEKIFFLGFSQGCCLTLEFICQNAQKFGGVVALTGGLIGDRIYPENYSGDFQLTPIFLGTSDPDPHVPLERFHATAQMLKSMNAEVTLKVYPHMGHTIIPDELDLARIHVFSH